MKNGTEKTKNEKTERTKSLEMNDGDPLKMYTVQYIYIYKRTVAEHEKCIRMPVKSEVFRETGKFLNGK